jgi:hypothetical protein
VNYKKLQIFTWSISLTADAFGGLSGRVDGVLIAAGISGEFK